MRVVTFLDTSIPCEFLRVPGKCQRPDEIRREVRERVVANESLLLPTAAIIETGNHIAQAVDGNDRREAAKRLVRVLIQTAGAKSPWVLNDATAGLRTGARSHRGVGLRRGTCRGRRHPGSARR